ncbi:MAG: ATP-binding protein [Pseudomonadota bacterium]
MFFREKKYFLPCSLAIINAVITYAALTSDDLAYLFNNPYGFKILFFLNGFFILLLLGLILGNIFGLRKKTKTHPDGSRFRYRLVVVFTLAALLPALMVAAFSAVTFKKAADGWFEAGVENAIYNAEAVSEAYIEEHNSNIKADSFATLSDLKGILSQRSFAVQDLLKQMRFQLLLRDLEQLILYNENGQIIVFVQSPRIKVRKPPSQLPMNDILQIKRDFPLTALDRDLMHVYALLPLNVSGRKFILRTDRRVNAKAVEFQKKTQNAVGTYDILKSRKRAAELGFALIYISFGLAAVTFMVYAGMFFATQMTRPLEKLTRTVQLLERGDPHARMPEPKYQHDEIDRLIVAFNRMATTLAEREDELIESNKRLNARRRLNEAVLAGVSSGVIGISREGSIRLINDSAAKILNISYDLGHLKEISAEFYTQTKLFLDDESKVPEFDYTYTTPQGEARYLHVKLSACNVVTASQERQIDIVITFDDVTELVKAQSMAAWRDVARRIAHEIKNPLTPISLSVERIKRKWGKNIVESKDLFDECTDTILRQVDHIRQTADSFSGFAKTPTPIKCDLNVVQILRDVIFLEQMRCPEVTYLLEADENVVTICADERLLSQAIINIMKNSAEAIKQSGCERGEILAEIHVQKNQCHIQIRDNGTGLPEHIPSYKLFEPYVTEREEGTGLGLAITAKIITDHGGRISLAPRQDARGAVTTLILPLVADKEMLVSETLEDKEIMV